MAVQERERQGGGGERKKKNEKKVWDAKATNGNRKIGSGNRKKEFKINKKVD